jgi:curli biogenesis system outer membrane secretion channel CsgG
MRRIAALAFTFLLLVAAPLHAQERRRVAVMDFDYATVKTEVAAIFGSDQDVGKGIVELLINQLVNDGTYRVIDRQAMAKILAEQNFANSNRADPNSASKIGKLLGVDTIIVGSITQFGRDDHHTGVGGGGGSWYTRAAGSINVKKDKAIVGITARMIDVNTGEILASTTANGESQRGGLALGGGGGNWWRGGGGGLDMGSSNFGQTILGEAVKDSVNKLAVGLDASSSKLPVAAAPPAIPVDAVVADASGNEITINAGTGGGVKVGQTLTVSRVGRQIKDPTTGKVLRSVETPLGQLTITSADAGSAVGNYTGTPGVKVGDHVKTP